MKTYKMYIDGKWVNALSGKTYPVINPANGEQFAEAVMGGVEDVDLAVAAAKKAFPIWSAKPVAERARILKEIAAKIKENMADIIAMDIIDHGSPNGFANGMSWAAPMFFDTLPDVAKTMMGKAEYNIMPGLEPTLRREPIGVVAGIVPWNIPLMISAKIASALATGNTCVVKPASVTPVGAVQLLEIIAKHPDLPAGAVNLVIGPGNTVGARLASHPDVHMVAFTGSSEAGRDIMAAAASTVKRLFLELGGKNPFIVLDDADVDFAAKGLADNLAFNTGMLCGAPGRVYVPESLHDKFLEKLIKYCDQIKYGDPNDKTVTMGPVISAEHRDKIEGYYKIGLAEGAKLVYGGKRPAAPLDKGFYVMPTIFTDVKQGSRLATEEIFGPVAVIIKYKTEEEVIAMANDNIFGLAASIWTTNTLRAQKVAYQIESGMVWVNTHSEMGGLPWGGVKQSGIGKEGGLYGLQEFTTLRSVCINLKSGLKL